MDFVDKDTRKTNGAIIHRTRDSNLRRKPSERDLYLLHDDTLM